MPLSTVLLIGLLAVVGQRPAFETVPISDLKTAEIMVRQSHAAWLAAADGLEERLLFADPISMRRRIAYAHQAKKQQLEATTRMYQLLIQEIDRSQQWLVESGPGVNLPVHDIGPTIQLRADQLRRQLEALEPDNVLAREVLRHELTYLEQLQHRLDEQQQGQQALRDIHIQRNDLEAAIRSRTSSVRSRLTRLVDDLRLEETQWQIYYDDLQAVLDSTAAARQRRDLNKGSSTPPGATTKPLAEKKKP